MSNINIHIIGSNYFLDLLKELDLGYNISSETNPRANYIQNSIRIIFVEKLNLTEVKRLIAENVPTIFLLGRKDFLVRNKLNLLSFHTSLILPLEVLTFKEILKILITKYNFFNKSKIAIKDYEVDSNQRIISKKNIQIKLTEKELELILTLNTQDWVDKSFLLKNIWHHNSDLESHAFETHLHRLRKKMNKFFKDNKFIIEKNSQYCLTK
jgi:DNA-binding response OmpR family regulator